MSGLMFARGAREQEDAPVGDAANNAARVEDNGAGCAGDSRRSVVRWAGRMAGSGWGMGNGEGQWLNGKAEGRCRIDWGRRTL